MGDLDFFELAVHLFAGFVLGSTFMVAVQHFQAWRRGRMGLLPLHVWCIALSYDLLLVSLITRTLDWRVWFYGPALVLGAVGMFALLRHQRASRRPPAGSG